MLEEASIRPYFIRAVYQWCIDEGYSPYILARWTEANSSKIPSRLVNDGKIVFNVSPEAVRHLVVNAAGIFFTARFLGKTTEVQVPLADVLSVYAREKQSGISFPPLPLSSSAALPHKDGEADEVPAGKQLRDDRGKNAEVDVKII